MKIGTFFKPTPIYKEYLLLSIISKDPHIKQRDIASAIDMSAGMVNIYMDKYEQDGLLKREYTNIKEVKYVITKKGLDRIKLLNIQFLESSLSVYNEAKTDCNNFFNKILEKGFKKILFYGAGEVAEIMLSVLNDNKYDFEVLALIDDDINKIGNNLIGKEIISLDEINEIDYDGILISTYSKSNEIYKKLINKDIDSNKIITFFEEVK